jgi:hypothetical protein
MRRWREELELLALSRWLFARTHPTPRPIKIFGDLVSATSVADRLQMILAIEHPAHRIVQQRGATNGKKMRKKPIAAPN